MLKEGREEGGSYITQLAFVVPFAASFFTLYCFITHGKGYSQIIQTLSVLCQKTKPCPWISSLRRDAVKQGTRFQICILASRGKLSRLVTNSFLTDPWSCIRHHQSVSLGMSATTHERSRSLTTLCDRAKLNFTSNDS